MVEGQLLLDEVALHCEGRSKNARLSKPIVQLRAMQNVEVYKVKRINATS